MKARSHSDHYVEVVYMDGLKYLGRKQVYYPPNQANSTFDSAVVKFSKSNLNVFIFLRDDSHKLLKAHRNYKPLKNNFKSTRK